MRIDTAQACPKEHVRGIGSLVPRIVETYEYLLDESPQGICADTMTAHAVPSRPIVVIRSEAKNLFSRHGRSFAALRMTATSVFKPLRELQEPTPGISITILT